MKSKMLVGLAVASMAATAAFAIPAPMFLKNAAQGDQSEVTLGNLAAQRGASAGVKDYGRRLASDHGAHLRKVQGLARRMRVALPSGMKPDARAAYRSLQRLRGAAFDRMFVQHMAADHRKDIGDYESQARSGDRQTATLARDTLPTLREHLRVAERLSH
ncbi:MAG: putative rane protein [Sphingomonadales bacterium]|nr:putative rane protein [Sphingomonadales bacterium]